jgi:filamentous hemagglutinin
MRDGFDAAGFPSTQLGPKGTQYTLPDGTSARLMEPTNYAPRRVSFENANGGPIDPFTGKPVQPPPGLTKPQRMDYVRARTHVEQDL